MPDWLTLSVVFVSKKGREVNSTHETPNSQVLLSIIPVGICHDK